jgi:hypothetical protein
VSLALSTRNTHSRWSTIQSDTRHHFPAHQALQSLEVKVTKPTVPHQRLRRILPEHKRRAASTELPNDLVKATTSHGNEKNFTRRRSHHRICARKRDRSFMLNTQPLNREQSAPKARDDMNIITL